MSVPADRIGRFLRDNPEGTLWVAMGYASAFGLAWLDARTAARPVRLLIGDTRTGFTHYSEVDRVAAIRFIRRPDVSVHNWSPARGTVHSKYYMVEPDSAARIAGDVLVGSANLTRQGLLSNVETLSRAHPGEHERLRAEMRDVMDRSWSAEEQLLRRLGATVHPSKGSPAGSASSRPTSASRGRQLVKAAAMIAGAFFVLLFALPAIVGLIVDFTGSLGSSAGSEPLATTPTLALAPSTMLHTSEGPEDAPASAVASSQHGSAAPTEPTNLRERPEVEVTAPPRNWEPEVGSNASSYGEPDRADLQWVAWQPECSSCEVGATLTWVGSYAHPFNSGVGRAGSSTRPKLQSSCLHRQPSGPLISWHRDVSGDRVEALWIDGESVSPGRWWIGGVEAGLMVPEPGAFHEILGDARQLRVLTAGGLDATFHVDGFLTTPAQTNLDHCGHYP